MEEREREREREWDGPPSRYFFMACICFSSGPLPFDTKASLSAALKENWTLVNCYKFDLHFDRLFLSSLHISFHCPSLPSLIFRKGNAHRAILCLLSRQIEFTSIYSRRTSSDRFLLFLPSLPSSAAFAFTSCHHLPGVRKHPVRHRVE